MSRALTPVAIAVLLLAGVARAQAPGGEPLPAVEGTGGEASAAAEASEGTGASGTGEAGEPAAREAGEPAAAGEAIDEGADAGAEATPGEPGSEAVGEEAVPAGPTSPGRVRVQLADGQGGFAPLPDVTVSLQGSFGAQEGVEQEATTDAEGVATFELADDDTRWVATVAHEGLTFLAQDLLTAGMEGDVPVVVYPTSADPSALRIDRLITLTRLNEGYLVFETYWFLSVHGDYVFQATSPVEGLEIRLPAGVEGIHVVEPTDENLFEQGDAGVRLLGPIGPRGALPTDGPTMLVTYSLANEDTRFAFEQPMPVPVDNAIVIVPLETNFSRYPRLNVDLEVPVCGSGVDPAAVVCFDSTAPPPAAMGLLPEVERREVHGGHGEAGAVLTFETVGWPSQRDPFKLAALLALGLFVLAGVTVWQRQRRQGPTRRRGKVPRPRLEAERRRLLAELKRAQIEYEEGLLPVSEFESTELILRYRLEVVYEALGVEPDPVASAEEVAEGGEDGSRRGAKGKKGRGGAEPTERGSAKEAR